MSDFREAIANNRKTFEARYPRAIRALRRAYADGPEDKEHLFLEMLHQIDDYAIIDPTLMEEFHSAYEFYK